MAYALLAIAALWLVWVYLTVWPDITANKATGLGALGIPGVLIQRYIPRHHQPLAAMLAGSFITLGWLIPLILGFVLLLW